jgi:hypothetical protein
MMDPQRPEVVLQERAAKGASKRGIVWDESNLAENELIKAELNPTKITEPKTPYQPVCRWCYMMMQPGWQGFLPVQDSFCIMVRAGHMMEPFTSCCKAALTARPLHSLCQTMTLSLSPWTWMAGARRKRSTASLQQQQQQQVKLSTASGCFRNWGWS